MNDQVLKNGVEKLLFRVNGNNVSLYNSQDDLVPENFTIVGLFSPNDLKSIVELIEKLRLVDHNQLYYEPDKLHLTLLGQIDLGPNIEILVNTVQKFIDQNEIRLHLLGVGSSLKAANVTAYPQGFQIDQLRQIIRRVGGGTSFDGPYEKLGWINFMRYLQKPKDQLFAELGAETNTDFGLVKPKLILLLRNSSRTLKEVEIVHSFNL